MERPIHPNDLHATILHALGMDQRLLYFERNNRREMVEAARLPKIEDRLGTIEAKMIADIVAVQGNPFRTSAPCAKSCS